MQLTFKSMKVHKFHFCNCAHNELILLIICCQRMTDHFYSMTNSVASYQSLLISSFTLHMT